MTSQDRSMAIFSVNSPRHNFLEKNGHHQRFFWAVYFFQVREIEFRIEYEFYCRF